MARVIQVRETFDGQAGEYRLWPIGDTHLGAIDCDEDALRRHLKTIEDDPAARVIFMGDVGDLIDYRDLKRWHPHPLPARYMDAMHDPKTGGIPAETVAHAAELFEKIAGQGKIWGWLSGNHERSVAKHHGWDIGQSICEKLNVTQRYLSYGGAIRVTFKRKSSAASSQASVVIDCHHGWQGGRRTGAKLNQLELELGSSDADIILRGHSHDRWAHVFPAWRIGTRYRREWPRVVAHTGTYKSGFHEAHDTWEHTRGFRLKVPTLMGPPVITLRIRGLDQEAVRRGQPSVTYELRT